MVLLWLMVQGDQYSKSKRQTVKHFAQQQEFACVAQQ
jgi:hypothetical protein